MSYNIQNVKIIKSSNAYILKSDIDSLQKEFEDDLPEYCFLNNLSDKVLNKKVIIDDLSWCYTWSGASYDDIFLKHFVPKIYGKIEAVLTWEDGEQSGLKIDNGKFTQSKVQFKLK